MWYSNRKFIYFAEKCLYSEVLKIASRVKDTSEMVTIIDNLNKSKTLTSDCRLVSFGIINMFPSIDNIYGLKAFQSILDARQDRLPPTGCIIEALKLCLECNNSIFNNKHFLQSDGKHKVLICHVLIAILPSNILMLKL